MEDVHIIVKLFSLSAHIFDYLLYLHHQLILCCIDQWLNNVVYFFFRHENSLKTLLSLFKNLLTKYLFSMFPPWWITVFFIIITFVVLLHGFSQNRLLIHRLRWFLLNNFCLVLSFCLTLFSRKLILIFSSKAFASVRNRYRLLLKLMLFFFIIFFLNILQLTHSWNMHSVF